MPEELAIVGGIDRDLYCPDLGQAEPEVQELGAVGQHDADLIPLGYSQILKGVGTAVGEAIHLRIGDILVLETQEDLGPVSLSPVLDQFTQSSSRRLLHDS